MLYEFQLQNEFIFNLFGALVWGSWISWNQSADIQFMDEWWLPPGIRLWWRWRGMPNFLMMHRLLNFEYFTSCQPLNKFRTFFSYYFLYLCLICKDLFYVFLSIMYGFNCVGSFPPRRLLTPPTMRFTQLWMHAIWWMHAAALMWRRLMANLLERRGILIFSHFTWEGWHFTTPFPKWTTNLLTHVSQISIRLQSSVLISF